MRVRNWLLAGTSLTLMMLAPGGMARAQDAAVATAYQAYQADKSDDNKRQLSAACAAAGFQSIDDCIGALKAPAATVDAAPAAEAPAAEAPAAPAADAPASSEEAPKKSRKAKPSSEEPAPAPAEQAAPPAEPAPAVEAPASSAEAPAPKKSKRAASSSEAPAVQEQAPAAVDQPSSEQAAPAAVESSAAAPAGNVLGELTTAVDSYNQGVANLAAGKKGAQRQIDKAKGQIDAICQVANFSDTTACLAQFGLSLSPLPAADAAVSSEVPAVSSEQPASTEASVPPADQSSAPVADQSSAPVDQASNAPSEVTTGPAASSEAPTPAVPVADTPQANETVSPDAVEPAPSNVPQDQLNSLFDADKTTADGSSKSTRGDKGGRGQPPVDGSSQPATDQSSSSAEQPAAPTTPTEPPKTTKEATADLPPPAPEQQTALGDKPTGKLDLKGPPGARPPKGGDFQIVDQPKGSKPDKGGIVFKIGINIFINNNEQERDRYYDAREDKIDYEQLRGGRVRETVSRPDGSQVVTVYGQNGEVLQRSKITPQGREIVLSTYDPRDTSDLDNWRDPGDDLPPLHVNIKARDYILDSNDSSEEDVLNFLDQPPVEKVRRIYSVDEIKRSARLRDTVRRLEIGGLTFDTGKATIARSQVDSLATVADAMVKILDKNPGAVFLIEGHTDAVGSDVANLVLSDQRASTVARILSDFYEIPPENLVSQGYGEGFLKVKTDGPEPLNRRVVIKNITPLVSYSADAN